MRLLDASLLACAAFALLVSAILVLLHMRSVRGTSLVSAWWLTIVALGAMGVACVVTLLPKTFDERTRDVVWYLSAVLSVCPGIAALGARRPVAAVWSVFVVLPLILVLCMPLISTWRSDTGRFGWILLETPMFLGFCLVVLMGSGNYIGTRFTVSALLAGASTVWIAVVFRFPGMLNANPASRRLTDWWIAAMLMAAAVAIALYRTRRRKTPTTDDDDTFESLWHDFVQTFGIVWAKRVGERINRAAEEERLPARLDLSGIVWIEQNISPETRAHAVSRLEHTLRILLKRFVDAEWIDARLGGQADSPSSRPDITGE